MGTDANCPDPGHGEAGAACAGCYAALGAEHTALSDRYMRLLAENQELERKLREAEQAGRVIPLPREPERVESGPAGFEHLHVTDVLQAGPRSRPAAEDVVVLRVLHRTTGGGRGILLERLAAARLHAWLGWWLEHGWPGVPRRCGEHHRPDRLHDWQCELDPGHLDDHEGRAVGWAQGEQPGQRRRWPLDPAERRARYDEEFGPFMGPFLADRRGTVSTCSPERCLHDTACYAPACYGDPAYGAAREAGRA